MRSFVISALAGAVALLLLLCSAAPSFAQDAPAFDVSAGYSFLRVAEVDDNFHGWLASGSVNVMPWLGVVGDVGVNSKHLDDWEITATFRSLTVGPRLVFRTKARITPFAQFLVGHWRRRVRSDAGETGWYPGLLFQPGGGVDFPLRRRAGIRIGGDYRRITPEYEYADALHEFRIHAGIVVSGGRR
jgi:hypothetical protein